MNLNKAQTKEAEYLYSPERFHDLTARVNSFSAEKKVLIAQKAAAEWQSKQWRRAAYFAVFMITFVNVILPSIYHTGFYK